MVECFKCDLCMTRTKIVYGSGNIDSDVMVIGEAPGYSEDKSGIPFVGRSGKLLRDYLNKYNIDAFITNVVKCRPQGNRDPSIDEINTCVKYFLAKEIRHVKPRFIITAGSISTSLFLKGNISSLNKGYYEVGKYIILPIFHPSYILRTGDTSLYDVRFDEILQILIRLV